MNSLFFSKKWLPISLLVMSFVFTGCLTDDGGGNGPVDELTTRDVQMGAQGNVLGSSLDADAMVVYPIAEARTRAGDIDLVFAFSTEQEVSAVYSPNVAVEGIPGVSEGFILYANFSPARTTPIRNVASSQWESVLNQSGLQSAWDGGTPQENGRLAVTAGAVFMIETSEDRLVMLRVDAVTQGEGGAMTLSGRSRF